MIPVNRKVGEYEIVRKIARGGMADVYLARDERSGNTVALKLIERTSDRDSHDSIEAERLGSDLQARLAAVDSRVVRIFETGDAGDHFFVAMEYIEGADLAELIHKGPLPCERAVGIAIEICETLESAHSLEADAGGKHYRGVVHGDVKPRNIRIDSEGRVRLLDFGIAKALSHSRRLTRNEFGSLQYAAPERLDTGQVDAASDLYSLGVVLYEMVTGRQPYEAESTSRLDAMIRSRIAPPPAPDPCPGALRHALAKALAPDPRDRYQSAGEFAAALRAIAPDGPTAGGAGDETRRTVRPVQLADEHTRRTVPPQPAAVPSNRSMRRRVWRGIWILILAGCLYGGWVATTTYLLWQRGEEFENRIKTEALTDPAQVWQQWTNLSGDDGSSYVLRGARQAVAQNLTGAADKIIRTYREMETQTVLQKDWEYARVNLTRALIVRPDDSSIRGKLRLCEGHIARISGTARRNTALLNQAADKFRGAQELMPRSPDPQLGLARLFVYGLKDIDRAYTALEQAEEHGHRLGNREKGQLADGYRERAGRLWKDAQAIRGLPQEKEQIERVLDDYRRALDLYQEIVPFGNATSSITGVQGAIDMVEKRQEELQGWFRRLWP